MKRTMLLFTIAFPFMLNQPATAQTSSRLVGEAHWTNNGAMFTPVDSTGFNYSGGRGGDLTHSMNYDNSTAWTYNNTDSAYDNSWYYIQTFDANNNLLTMTSEYWNGSAWVLNTKNLYTYNSSNQRTTLIQQTWGGSSWTPVSQDVYTYNPGGQLYVDIYETWDGLSATFVPSTQKTYYYDASGNRINETDQVFISGTPQYTNEWVSTYSSSNQMLTSTYNTWSGSSWTPVNMTTDTYDSTGDMISSLYQTYDGTSSTWVNSTLDLYSSFNSAHMAVTDVAQTWDDGTSAWDNSMQYTNTYNSYNQLTSRTGESWNVVGLFEFASGDPRANYYYETYTPGTGTTAAPVVVANDNDANIFPVPAQNMLYVNVKWADAQSANITVVDMTGRIVRQWDAPSGTEYRGAVSVNGLADGTYFIKIAGTSSQIVKQFVVAH
jgi:Secretion system C-terminal sorting domain